ncbi:uncharacterized protein E0L32_009604 [Thyridium curvatum]|uniref:R3H domain-containing protein n=1 Tax=Thyridium curvatum TaxID=1093900 RepID=A0A507AX89_9PEZI|nr:uncharacterized protein E0L32_009604 [Thyridium curvatum]TPX08900.1 hypothetical protein E0L32_009604 [Thyridium curvatum]
MPEAMAAESRPPAPSSRGGHRGPQRGGRSRRGRGRGRGGAARTAEEAGRAAPAPLEHTHVHTDNASVQSADSHRGSQTTDRSRGGRGRRGGPRPRGGRGAPSVEVATLGPRRAFGGHLTADAQPDAVEGPALSGDAPVFVPGQPVVSRPTTQQAPPKVPHTRRASKSSALDLPTRIHEDIDNGQYECVICTGEVLRTSQIWSCSLCWTVAHLHCVKKWYKNQMKKDDQPQNPDQPKTWRCPGCNSAMGENEEPRVHHCWCGKEINAKSIVGLPPHSCGQTCSKPRSTCPHPCPQECHAGPCEPCKLMGPEQACFCGKNASRKRCSETDYINGWSCHELCGDLLPCGEHTCVQECHPGLCGTCALPMPSRCYCGKEQKELPCEQRDELLESFNYGQVKKGEEEGESQAIDDEWFDGSFHCGSVCGRKFDCGVHECQKKCHPQDEKAAHCTFSPDIVSHCPCGKTALTEILETPRQSCRDPIPHCSKTCEKVLPCGHRCQNACHDGACEPCMQTVDIPCRCGRTTTEAICHKGLASPPQCERICRAQLNCGRHECGKPCCSGERRATERQAAKRKRNANTAVNEEFEAEHICLRTCGRLLKCGTHRCQELCHKGPCGSCREAIFDEIACSCGRTVLYPPQPCGTRPPECRFDCTKPRACGHPTVQHNCHPDDVPCPKCPFLVEKTCICGKQNLKNQPCWFDEVRCGLPCGKTLKCGTHKCMKLCHKPGECEDAGITGSHCTQPCGKTRRSCEHVCTDECHAPYACKEDRPCQSKTFVTCDCQNRKQEVRCLASRTNPFPAREPLKCDDECLRLQRNARLAQALNIDPATHTDDHVPYSDATLKLFRESTAWAQAQEREFRVFAEDRGERRLRFRPMPAHQRAFLHALAEDFGLDSESQDPEPHRHVAVFKTPRFVSAPRKTLAQCVSILKAQAPPPATPAAKASAVQPYNAFLLSAPRFALTIDEVGAALAPHLAGPGGAPSGLSFHTTFLPSDDKFVVKASAPGATAASVARSGPAPTPAGIETSLTALKPAVARAVAADKLAGSVTLCAVDDAGHVVRHEGDGSAGGAGSGWSAVAGRAAARPRAAPATGWAINSGGKLKSSFVALRKKAEMPRESEREREREREEAKAKAAREQEEEVEEDWEDAAEKLED